MIIYGVCRSCSNHLSLGSEVASRPALLKEIGDSSKLNCKRCGVTTTFTVNELKAKLPKRIRRALTEVGLLGIVILISTHLLLSNLTYTAIAISLYTLPALVYVLYTRKNIITVEDFNRTKI